jgi:hypothetical protein
MEVPIDLSKSPRVLSVRGCNLAKRSLSSSKRRSIPLNSVDMLPSFQDILTLCTQDREVVCIAAQDVRLVLDPRRCVLLKEQHTLDDHRVRQLNGRPVQQHNIDIGCPQDSGQLMSKGDYRAPPVDRGIDQNGKVIVAHRTCVIIDLRAKEVHQTHSTLVPKHRCQLVLE